MDKKFNFKLDKDKIKLQLKALSKKISKRKSKFRNAFLVFLLFTLLGIGLTLYNTDQNTNNSADQLTQDNPGFELDFGEDQPSFYSDSETESNFSLNYPQINENQYEAEENLQPVIEGEEGREGEEVEGVVTEPVRPIDQIQGGDALELLKPVSGDIVQDAGWYYHPVLDDWRYQQGVEISGNTGDIVMAAADGRITSVLEDDYKGIMVLIEHQNGWITEYGHLQRTIVAPGQQVGKGEEIGRVGVTGMTSQPSLYFSLKNQDGAIDPVAYFE
ncbi:MAG: peptidoglycan DD-metalloendopeptidase family protein [Halanaerobiales bacterium]